MFFWDGGGVGVHSLVVIFIFVTLRDVAILRNGMQLGDVADALGDTLSEEHLGPRLQVLGMLEEFKLDVCFFPCPQLLLPYVEKWSLPRSQRC